MRNMVRCLDAFTDQRTRLVVVVDGLDSCEQSKVILLNCVGPKSEFGDAFGISPTLLVPKYWYHTLEQTWKWIKLVRTWNPRVQCYKNP